MERLQAAVTAALGKRGLDFSLKNEQLRCISNIVLNEMDVLAVLPTGYGKSIIYQLLPDIYDFLRDTGNSIVLVVSPLNALMRDQVVNLNQQGISASMIQGHGVFTGEVIRSDGNDESNELNVKLPLTELADPTFKLLYMHPECVEEKKMVEIFNSPIYQDRVRCVVVDEAHLVLDWDSFRPAYGKLDILVSIFPKIPHLALTATATLKSQQTICDKLQMKNTLIVSVNPDRPKIFLQSKERPATGADKLHSILEPLCKELLDKKVNMPLTVVYGTLDVCTTGFSYFTNRLGKKQYFPSGAAPVAKNRLFAQYHAEYPKHEKDALMNDLINNVCKARVLFVTVAFGIGVDLPSIRRVIHIGVPRTMEEYFQEVGRAGRDGVPAIATIYFNRYDVRSGKDGIDLVMKELVLGKDCKRQLILKYFGHELTRANTNEIHTCCDNDADKCECDKCNDTTLSLHLQNVTVDGTSLPNACSDGTELLSITNVQKTHIRKALEEHMHSLYFGPSCVGGISLATGFTPELIESVVQVCEQLVSMEAVERLLPVFSKENATVIFNIVRRFAS